MSELKHCVYGTPITPNSEKPILFVTEYNQKNICIGVSQADNEEDEYTAKDEVRVFISTGGLLEDDSTFISGFNIPIERWQEFEPHDYDWNTTTEKLPDLDRKVIIYTGWNLTEYLSQSFMVGELDNYDLEWKRVKFNISHPFHKPTNRKYTGEEVLFPFSINMKCKANYWIYLDDVVNDS